MCILEKIVNKKIYFIYCVYWSLWPYSRKQKFIKNIFFADISETKSTDDSVHLFNN